MTIRILEGDCREVLPDLPDESVHCVVSSPPYWGLRDYGTAQWEGGDPACDHRKSVVAVSADSPSVRATTLNCGAQYALKTTAIAQSANVFRDCCGKCGARRIDAQLGLEPTPAEYVANMVEVFREVRRVLRKDGTLWLNLGDSYAASVNGRSAADTKAAGNDDRTFRDKPFSTVGNGLKPKDLCGIPWRVAFALQADGWYLRQDIIWSKPNPMPESVTDRCTKAHEYIFLLSKSERYYYNAEAIAEPTSYPEGPGNIRPVKGASMPGFETRGGFGKGPMPSDTRNKRSVWQIATAPFLEAHFATFPPALIEPCILAGCPKGGTVLDPFGGAGTTGLVADRLQRNAILIELKPAYAEMARDRITDDAPLFNPLDDITKSVAVGLEAIRERKANGGPGWGE